MTDGSACDDIAAFSPGVFSNFSLSPISTHPTIDSGKRCTIMYPSAVQNSFRITLDSNTKFRLGGKYPAMLLPCAVFLWDFVYLPGTVNPLPIIHIYCPIIYEYVGNQICEVIQCSTCGTVVHFRIRYLFAGLAGVVCTNVGTSVLCVWCMSTLGDMGELILWGLVTHDSSCPCRHMGFNVKNGLEDTLPGHMC